MPQETVTSSENVYHSKLQQFMKKGVMGIIWSEVDFKSLNIGAGCKSSLLLIKEHLQLESQWAYKCEYSANSEQINH